MVFHKITALTAYILYIFTSASRFSPLPDAVEDLTGIVPYPDDPGPAPVAGAAEVGIDEPRGVELV